MFLYHCQVVTELFIFWNMILFLLAFKTFSTQFQCCWFKNFARNSHNKNWWAYTRGSLIHRRRKRGTVVSISVHCGTTFMWDRTGTQDITNCPNEHIKNLIKTSESYFQKIYQFSSNEYYLVILLGLSHKKSEILNW